MKNILVLYASMSGNTEKMAFAIAEGLQTEETTVEVIDIFEIEDSIETFSLENYSGILIGSYTWMDGEVPDEFLTFYDDLPLWDLSNKKATVFGSYDGMYGNQGAAIDLFIDALTETKAEIVLEPLKIELRPSAEELETCKKFGKNFISKLWTRKRITQAV